MSNRVQVEVITAAGQKPIARVRVLLMAGDGQAFRPLASRMTDLHGRCSFEVNRLRFSREDKWVRVALHGFSRTQETIRVTELRNQQPLSVVLKMEASAQTLQGLLALKSGKTKEDSHVAPGKRIGDALGMPSAEEIELSPEQFGDRAAIAIGQGQCQQIFTDAQAEQTFRGWSLGLLGGEVRFTRKEAKDDSSYQVIQSGYLSSLDEFTIEWLPIKHFLGEVVYSLPLAPCESVNLAVIDWSRAESASRDEETLSEEQLTHAQSRDRVVDETVHGALRERVHGGSSAGGLGLSVGSKDVGLNLGFGMSRSHSTGTRTLDTGAVQRVFDRLKQESAAARALRSSVVIQGTQAEREEVSTRTVRNHNHGHALTILYYQLLRLYSVSLRHLGRKPVVLLPYGNLFGVDDDPGKLEVTILDRQQALRRLLPTPDLVACIEAVERANGERTRVVTSEEENTESESNAVGGEAAPYLNSVESATVSGIMIGSFQVEFDLSASQGSSHQLLGRVVFSIDLPNGESHEFDVRQEHFSAGEFMNRADALTFGDVDTGGNDGMGALLKAEALRESWVVFALGGGTYKFRVPGHSIDASRIVRIRLRIEHPAIAGATIGYWEDRKITKLVVTGDSSISGGSTAIFSTGLTPVEHVVKETTEFVGQGPAWLASARTGTEATKRQRAEDLASRKRLIRHLRANSLYYSRELEMARDPEVRAARFSRFFEENPTSGQGPRRLLDIIEPVPVAYQGEYLAFPIRNDTPEFANFELGEAGGIAATVPAPDPISGIGAVQAETIALPVRGVFAEAKLGHCNGCEERDVTRFWNWSESPCPDSAPPISAPLGSRDGGLPDTSPTPLPTTLTIMNAPSAPDPTGTAAALAALSAAGVFPNMAGTAETSALVSDLARGAITMQEASRRAESIASRGGSLAMGGPSAGRGLTMSARDAADALQLARTYTEQGLLPEDSVKRVFDRFVGEESGSTAGKAQGKDDDVGKPWDDKEGGALIWMISQDASDEEALIQAAARYRFRASDAVQLRELGLCVQIDALEGGLQGSEQHYILEPVEPPPLQDLANNAQERVHALMDFYMDWRVRVWVAGDVSWLSWASLDSQGDDFEVLYPYFLLLKALCPNYERNVFPRLWWNAGREVRHLALQFFEGEDFGLQEGPYPAVLRGALAEFPQPDGTGGARYDERTLADVRDLVFAALAQEAAEGWGEGFYQAGDAIDDMASAELATAIAAGAYRYATRRRMDDSVVALFRTVVGFAWTQFVKRTGTSALVELAGKIILDQGIRLFARYAEGGMDADELNVEFLAVLTAASAEQDVVTRIQALWANLK